MKYFKTHELVIVLAVLSTIGIFSIYNLRIAQRRARDFQRKDDISNLANALFYYREDLGFYPPSSPDGKIIACHTDEQLLEDSDELTSKFILSNESMFRQCQYGYDSIEETFKHNPKTYIKIIPGDPKTIEGYSYRYVSTDDSFQLFASLESDRQDEFDSKIKSRSLICGIGICNFGKSSPGTPLDKSLEEYENEILNKVKKNNE
jgi:type II secretory pathway pseudopilin PulG